MINPFQKLKRSSGGNAGASLTLSDLLPGLHHLRLSGPERLALIAALVLIATVIFFYVTRVRALGDEIATLRNREQELRSRLDKRGVDEKKRRDQNSNAEQILGSLEQFERGLKNKEEGMSALISELDTLGRKNRIIVGDASYRVEESALLLDEKGNPVPAATTGERQESVYPGMAIDTTVIGDYPNLRRFIAALEQSRQFVIINSLAFQGEGDKVRRETAKVGQAVQVELASPDAVPVSLKIELDTYFQKSRPTP